MKLEIKSDFKITRDEEQGFGLFRGKKTGRKWGAREQEEFLNSRAIS